MYGPANPGRPIELLRNLRSASPIIDTLAEHIAEGFRQ
jgi:hypothetical protein